MTSRQVPDQAQLPIALCVATGHEARRVQRALDAANTAHPSLIDFTVVQVGVGCCSMDSNQLVDTHSAIVSTGFAGALDPVVVSGALLRPEYVKKTDSTQYSVDRHLQQTIATNVRAVAIAGPLLHTDCVLASRAQKQSAREKTHCVACDMESASLAAAAQRGGKPFACLRIVLDPADTIIPAPIMAVADSQTEPTAAVFLKTVLRHPSQLWATAVFLWHTFKASRALSASVTQWVEGCRQ